MDNVIALSLIEDHSSDGANGHALLFSCLVEEKLRSLLVKQKVAEHSHSHSHSHLITDIFPRLSILYCQNPTKLSVAQLVGTILSSSPGPCSVCSTALPIEVLTKLCSAAISYDCMKLAFAMCSDLLPGFLAVETSPPITSSVSTTPAVSLDPEDETNVELLITSLRDKLLVLRSSSPANEALANLSPAGRPSLLQANPVLDQWLRGLWSIGLPPQSPALHAVSSRLALATADSPSSQCNSPQTDGSVTPLSSPAHLSTPTSPSMYFTPSHSAATSSFSLRDDASLLIDARCALRSALLLERSSSGSSSGSSSSSSQQNLKRRGIFRLTSSGGDHDYPTTSLWPCLVLAEALGCTALAAALIDSLRGILASEQASAADAGLADARSSDWESIKSALMQHLGKHPPTLVPKKAPETPQTDTEDSLQDDDTPQQTHLPHSAVMTPDSLALPQSRHAVTPFSPASPFTLRSSLDALPSSAFHSLSQATEAQTRKSDGELPSRECPSSPAPVPQRLPAHPIIQDLMRDKEERERERVCVGINSAANRHEALPPPADKEEKLHMARASDERHSDADETTERDDEHLLQPQHLTLLVKQSSPASSSCLGQQTARARDDVRQVTEPMLLPSRSEHEPVSIGSRVDRNKSLHSEEVASVNSTEPSLADTSFQSTQSSSSSHSRNTNTSASSSSFRADCISRTLAGIRTQPLLMERRRAAQQAAAEQRLRKSRVDGVLLQQAMARVGYGVSSAKSGLRNESIGRASPFRSGASPASARSATPSSSSSSSSSTPQPKIGSTPWSRASQTRPPTPTSGAARPTTPWMPATRPHTPTPAHASTLVESPAPDLAAQRRAQARVRARHHEMLTAAQKADIAKRQRERAMWAARDKKIQMFVDRQKGGALYLMSSGSDSRASDCYSPNPLTAPAAKTAGPSSYTPQPQLKTNTPSDSGPQLELHGRQPWNVGSPYSGKEADSHAEAEAEADAANQDDGDDQDEAPPPAPPLTSVQITVLRAYGLQEGLGGCNPYVLLDWSSLGRHATRPAGDRHGTHSSPRPLTNVHFHETFEFRPPFIWSSSGIYDVNKELDGREVHISIPSPGNSATTTTTTATLCAPVLRVLVYSRNVSVSDELLGEGETDVEAMLLACQQGVPFTVQLYDMTRRQVPVGCVEMAFSI